MFNGDGPHIKVWSPVFDQTLQNDSIFLPLDDDEGYGTPFFFGLVYKLDNPII